MSNKTDGFKIPLSQRQSWISLTMIWVGSMICIPSLMVGSILGASLSFPVVIASILLGYGIICLYMCLMGMQACDTGMPTVRVAASALGQKGSQFVIGLLLAVACIGWFGVQAAVCGAAFSTMLSEMTGFNIPAWLSAGFWGIVMLVTAMYGYKGVKYINYVAVPALVIVLVYGVYAAIIQNDGIPVILGFEPTESIGLVSGIGLVIGSFALGGVVAGDFCRYAKSRSDVVKSSLLGLLPSGLVVLAIGAGLSIATGQYDISAVLTTLGLPAIGLVTLVIATWSTNVANGYSGGIAVSSLLRLEEKSFKTTTFITGMIGTILGALSLTEAFASFGVLFQGFLGLLSTFIPPVAGAIIASYWIVGKGKAENFKIVNGFNVAGIIAFILGAAIAWVTANVWIFFSGPLNGIIVSLVAYLVLVKLIPPKYEEVPAEAESLTE